MGLDQYAFSAPEALTVEKNEDGRLTIKGVHGEEFQWRKHAKLQEFFEGRVASGRLVPMIHDSDFNCNPVLLDIGIIDDLEMALKTKTMPSSGGGCFYGHQFQDESADDYKEQDLKFCAWAREEMAGGDYVYYDCWW